VAEAPLGLEGLELQRVIQSRKDGVPGQTLLAASKGLYAANCRFLAGRVDEVIFSRASPCELRNCELLSSEGGHALCVVHPQPGRQFVMENCLVAGHQSWGFNYRRVDDEEYRVRLTRNTFRADAVHVDLRLLLETVPNLKQLNEGVKGLRVEASGNVFHAGAVLAVGRTLPPEHFPPADVHRFLGRYFEWKGERNVYAVQGSFARGRRSPGSRSRS
jgi:hypothetical protein